MNAATGSSNGGQGGCGDPSAVSGTAAELFQLAALLVGDPSQAVKLVEESLAGMEIDPCLEPAAARRLAEQQLLRRAVAVLRQNDPASFEKQPSAAGAVCVEDDSLDAAGISQSQLAAWLAGEGRGDLRAWLAALPGAQRAVFVQRAVLGHGNAATAQMLAAPSARETVQGWTPEAVGEAYRLALCSLANSLAHTPAAMTEAAAAHA